MKSGIKLLFEYKQVVIMLILSALITESFLTFIHSNITNNNVYQS
jgi:hypothetical protein